MRTVVISDLHLGATSGADLLRREDLRAELAGALGPGDRLVVLGDVIEMREVPVRAAAAAARPLLGVLGEAVGSDGEIVLVAGNHDHGLVAPWLEARLMRSDPPRLGLEETVDPALGGPLVRDLAAAAGPAPVRVAYPGVWLRDDVYAIHGHYSDLHTTVPTFERLAAGAMERWVARIPDAGASPDDYEAVLAPIYAWMHVLAQRASHGVIKAGAGASARAWNVLSGDGRARSPRVMALSAGYAGAVAAVNRLGIGPVRRDLSGQALRQGGLTGMGEAIRRLEIGASHVIWGHSHRAGPFERDDPGEWTAPDGTRMHNCGSWVFQPHFLRGAPGVSPYWPGTAVVVEETGPPRLERLLGERTHAQLTPPPRA